MIKKILLGLGLLVSGVYSWGAIGHSTIGNLADLQLTSIAKNEVSTILNGANLEMVANWADQVKTEPEWKWSAPLHYINTPDWTCDYIETRDCYDSNEDYLYCVDGGIKNYTNRIQTNTNERDIDLKFLTHFIGDIYQPLHCGFKEDIGGNAITVYFNNIKTNLHTLWDTTMIEYRISTDFNNSTEEWVEYLRSKITSPRIQKRGYWMTRYIYPDSVIWANDSVKYACLNSYVHVDGAHIKSGDTIEKEYYDNNIKLIEDRLVSSSESLATLLNKIFK